MIAFEKLARFFPLTAEAVARGADAQAIQGAFDQDVDLLRGKGLIAPLESAAGMVCIECDGPVRVSFSEDNAIVQRLLRS